MKRLLLLALWAACSVAWAAPETASDVTEPAAQPATAPSADTDPEAEAGPSPVTGAFGVPLGMPFEPCRVAEVLGEKPKSFKDRDGNSHEGKEFQVRPRTPNPHFDHYSVLTNEHGVVYSVQAAYEDPEKAKTCDLTKELAALLEAKYGPPRGKGSFGEWYAFRDMSVDHYRGIRLISNRCRRGLYSIQYSDDGAKALVPDAPAPPGSRRPVPSSVKACLLGSGAEKSCR